jgi:hypothetical protein
MTPNPLETKLHAAWPQVHNVGVSWVGIERTNPASVATHRSEFHFGHRRVISAEKYPQLITAD